MKEKILITSLILLLFNFTSTGQNTDTSDNTTDESYEMIYSLMLDFMLRTKENAKELEKITGKEIHCYISEDPSESFCYIYITEKELKKYFNLEILHRIIKGAGNSMYTDAHYYDISNIEELSPHMKKILKQADIIDDPKFEIYAEEKPEDFDLFFSE